MRKLFIPALVTLLVGLAGVSKADDDLEGLAGVYPPALPRAEQGDAQSQYYVGKAFHFGLDDVMQDYLLAHEWYGRAAKQGHKAANYRLGDMYRFARGVATDYDKAYDYYTKGPLPQSFLPLGRINEVFYNDKVLAHHMYSLAAHYGDEDAADYRDDIEKKMTVDEVNRSHKMARELREAHGRGAGNE